MTVQASQTQPSQRLPLVEVDEMPDDLRAMVERWREQEDGDPNFIRTLANAPDMLRRFVPFYAPLVLGGVVEHRTKEIVRIDIAWHNQCRYCMATRYGSGRRAGIDEALVAEIARYESGPFSERERVALRYADATVVDPHDVPAEVVERLSRSFDHDEALELTWAICLWIETGRLFAALEVPYGAEAPSGRVGIDLAPRRPPPAAASASAPSGIDPDLLATLARAPRRLERFLHFFEHAGVEPFGDDRLKRVLCDRVEELDRLARCHALPERPRELEPPAGLREDELALVRFADAFAVDYRSIPDARYDDLWRHFDGGELTELLWTFAVTRGMARVAAVLGLPLAA